MSLVLGEAGLANSPSTDVDELPEQIIDSIDRIRNSATKLRGCIPQSELPALFCTGCCTIYAEINNGSALDPSFRLSGP